MKLGLGTVQFGLDYGIANYAGHTPIAEVKEIIRIAEQNGIRVLDTAAGYGTSEESLGYALPEVHQFKIVTKTPSFNAAITREHCDLLKSTFYKSLKKMNCQRLYGLLMHNANDLSQINGGYLLEQLLFFKNSGLVEKIGVSVYTAEQIDKVLDIFIPDLIQLPLNVFDQRLIHSGHLKQLKSRGVEIHVRSVFLQGLLLMGLEKIPPFFNSIRTHIQAYQQFLKEAGISAVSAAIMFAEAQKEVDCVLVGVDNHTQLQEILAGHSISPKHITNINKFAVANEFYLNPSNWPRK